MDFEIIRGDRSVVLTEPQGWGDKYKKLHKATQVSGFEEWLATAHNDFSNPFAEECEKLYNKHGHWEVITRDMIMKGGHAVGSGLKINYISHANVEGLHKEQKVVAPERGYVIATPDSARMNSTWIPYFPDTLIPHATLNYREQAVKINTKYFMELGHNRKTAKKLAEKWTPYFSRPERYDVQRFVGRVFCPGPDGYGRFGVDAGWLPSGSGGGWVASRPAYKGPLLVAEFK